MSTMELPNYTGPYRSDGAWQPSVPFGKSKPKNRLDRLSRMHDTAYYFFKDDPAWLAAADYLYARDAATEQYGAVAGHLVTHFNMASRIAQDVINHAVYKDTTMANTNGVRKFYEQPDEYLELLDALSCFDPYSETCASNNDVLNSLDRISLSPGTKTGGTPPRLRGRVS